MRQQIFLSPINLNISKFGFGLGVSDTRVAYRLRGPWRYAQDTVPIRACFSISINRLRVLCGVSPSVTGSQELKKSNKNNVGAVHG